jgi:hypothetical protein
MAHGVNPVREACTPHHPAELAVPAVWSYGVVRLRISTCMLGFKHTSELLRHNYDFMSAAAKPEARAACTL